MQLSPIHLSHGLIGFDLGVDIHVAHILEMADRARELGLLENALASAIAL